MGEFIGLAYYAEIPGVFFDIQRTGPSTGMPTRTQQGDLLSIAYLSHGDTKHIALFPANPEECFYLAVEAFDLAERFQTPVFVVSDLDIGMNDWMCQRVRRGTMRIVPIVAKCSAPRSSIGSELLALPGYRRRRHRGAHAAGRASARRLFHPRLRSRQARCVHGGLRPSIWKSSIDWRASWPRRRRLFRRRRCTSQSGRSAADIGIISLGGCHAAVLEAVDRLRERGQSVDYMRIRAFPFAPCVRSFIEAHERCYVVEQNRDGQLRYACWRSKPALLVTAMSSILDYGGLPLTADRVGAGVSSGGSARANGSN